MPHNRVIVCPECGGSLRKHKNPCISDNGFAYRTRKCSVCGVVVHTKQPPEEITGVEPAARALSEKSLCRPAPIL